MADLPMLRGTYLERISYNTALLSASQYWYQTDTGQDGATTYVQGYYLWSGTAWGLDTYSSGPTFEGTRYTFLVRVGANGPYIGLVHMGEVGGGQWFIGSSGSDNTPGLGYFEIYDNIARDSRFRISPAGVFQLLTTNMTLFTTSGTSGPYIQLSHNSGDGGRNYYIGSSGSGNGPGAGYLEIVDATAAATRGTVDSNGLLNWYGAVAFSGDITPTQIAADQNNYNPTGLSGASVLRLSSDASRNITGLQGGQDGRVLMIFNVGAQNIVLADESASSDAANRFALKAAITINADGSATLQYDSTSLRWRVIATY